MRSSTRFSERHDAGPRLAEKLIHHDFADPALLPPRGGVPFAPRVARARPFSPPAFGAVGLWYDGFRQTSDAEVRDLATSASTDAWAG